MSEIFDDKIKESFEKKGIADRNLARVLVSFPVQFLLLSEEEFESLCKIYVSTPTKDRLEKSGGAPHPQLDVSGTMAAAIVADGILPTGNSPRLAPPPWFG